MFPCALIKKDSFFYQHQDTFSKIALIVGLVAGAALIALGVVKVFGPINDVRSIACIVSGGFLVVASGIRLIVISCREKKSDVNEEKKPQKVEEKKSDVRKESSQKIDIETFKANWQKAKDEFVAKAKDDPEYRRHEDILCDSEGDKWHLRHYISKKAGIDVQDAEGKTALFRAVESGRIELVQYLRNEIADQRIKDNKGRTAFFRAVELGHFEIAKLVNFPPFQDENGAIEPACREVKDSQGRTALYCMAEKGDLAAVKFLVEEAICNIHVRSNNHTALWIAEQNGHREVALYLKSKGADDRKDELGSTPLVKAVAAQNLTEVQKLVTQFDVNATDFQGITAVIQAAWGKSVEIMKCLLDSGGDLLVTYDCERTPLHVAADRRNFPMVQYLVNARNRKNQGIDINALTTDGGFNALYFAAFRGDHKTFEFLLANGATGAHIRTPSYTDQTPLSVMKLNLYSSVDDCPNLQRLLSVHVS